jgi:hypothetical protein
MFKRAGDARQAKLLIKMKRAIAPGIALNAGEDNYIARNRHSAVNNFSMNDERVLKKVIVFNTLMKIFFILDV